MVNIIKTDYFPTCLTILFCWINSIHIKHLIAKKKNNAQPRFDENMHNGGKTFVQSWQGFFYFSSTTHTGEIEDYPPSSEAIFLISKDPPKTAQICKRTL